MAKKILLVEDEQPIREMLRYALEREDYMVEEADCAEKAREMLARKRPDLIVVDWMMPGESGVEFIRRLRKDEILADLPVIMLTARVEEKDKVKGLDCGADDYLTKPVGIKEFIARIKALLRRTSQADEEDKLNADGMELNLATNQLTIEGENVHIGQTEFNLLQFFIEHKNRVYSRTQLLDFVWGQAVYIEERTVDVHILRLRKILKPHHKDKLIKTVRGMGYMFTHNKAA
ncbi:phosphate regulon transcriptional regulator PhoB [Aliikangiella coralliicola]|uniref:Phosphate regulon transcriptional regulatory protein PhoB n=1 Tax=Aliikangiella coralliicola TaxID=2592383 RepID=A0A545UHG7_9GAMM|nr:phosphate regulon transcriptional regulator PhoB [Aliikangiella coralliicola]TQV88916.1 phosphate regulon transcriptional regulatory protein PhoB [Aliikangiella coralliicola]